MAPAGKATDLLPIHDAPDDDNAVAALSLLPAVSLMSRRVTITLGLVSPLVFLPLSEGVPEISYRSSRYQLNGRGGAVGRENSVTVGESSETRRKQPGCGLNLAEFR